MSNMSTSTSKHFQGYGDPEGDPEASKARKDQKPANLKQTSIEHPGPEPVGAGKGKGGDGANVGKNYNKEPGMESKHGRGAYGESPTSDHPKDPGEASAQSGGSRSKDAKEQHERAVADETTAESDDAGMSGGDGASTSGAPKSSLKGGNKSASEGKSTDNKGDRNQDVDAHNKEFENTGDRKMKNDEERKGRYSYARFPFRGFFILPIPVGFVWHSKVQQDDRERMERNYEKMGNRARRRTNEWGDEILEVERQVDSGAVGDTYYESVGA